MMIIIIIITKTITIIIIIVIISTTQPHINDVFHPNRAARDVAAGARAARQRAVCDKQQINSRQQR